jgi:hypothetical protein
MGVSSSISICAGCASGSGVGSGAGVSGAKVLSLSSVAEVPVAIEISLAGSASDTTVGSGSGVTEGSGVGSLESTSTCAATTDARGFLPRFFGTDFEGEVGRAASWAGVNNCVGSTDSVTRGRRRVVGFGVTFSSAAAVLRGRPRPLPVLSGAGAGVKSSSSSWTSGVGVRFSSPSESSIIGAFRRVAAARVDLRGDSEAILTVAVMLVSRGRTVCLLLGCATCACCVHDARTNMQNALSTCITPRSSHHV